MKFIPNKQIIHNKKLYTVGGSYEISPEEKEELKDYGEFVDDVKQTKDNEVIEKINEVEKPKADKTTTAKRGRPAKK